MIEHVVRQGECVASIAADYGAPAKKVWNAPENDELREKRDSPNVLLPGDRVFINDQDRKDEACATEQRHRFRKHGQPVYLRLQFLDMGEARAGEKYTLKIDGRLIEGTTDGEGKIEVVIPARAEEAVLRLGEKARGEDYVLRLGELDPVTEPSGVQARLSHLGYRCGEPGKMDELTRRAVREFQYDRVLKMGEVNDETREELVKAHGS
jgi:Putative peptidoglycan binding domain